MRPREYVFVFRVWTVVRGDAQIKPVISVRLNTGRKGIQLRLKTSSWNISYLDKTPQRVTAQDGMEARGREAGGPHPPPPEPRIEKKNPTRLFIDQRGSHTS